jgi:hypothetical protein
MAKSLLQNWCQVHMEELVGVWAMEILHAITWFGDLYQTSEHPGGFDNMACSCGTHPSTFTKLQLGWLDPAQVVIVPAGEQRVHTLHAVGLVQPPPPGRVTAVRVPSKSSSARYFLAEARLRVDQYERTTPGVSSGIPSEGVVVYEVDESTWAPMKLRTKVALSAGQEYTNAGEQLKITVDAAVPGGFTVTVTSAENAACEGIRKDIANAKAEIETLQTDLQQAHGSGEKAQILGEIRHWKAEIANLQKKGHELGCSLPRSAPRWLR